MSSDTCHHNRNLMWGCSECELEGKLSALRRELAEAKGELHRFMEHSTVLSTRLAAALDRRDKLGAELEDCLSDLRKAHHRITELEKKHENDADQFASGRRYEQSWGEVRVADAEDMIVSLQNQLEFERDLRVQAERRYAELVEDTKEEEGGSDE